MTYDYEWGVYSILFRLGTLPACLMYENNLLMSIPFHFHSNLFRRDGRI